MWRKCGTKISNEINELNICVFFFGSGIYQFSLFLRGELLSQHPSPKSGADMRLCS
jgi:hypothetical protein